MAIVEETSRTMFSSKRSYSRLFMPHLSGVKARDAGMQLVMANNPDFSYQYFNYILAMPPGSIFLNEDIKAKWTGTPAKPQAWGANVNACLRNGLLEHLPIETQMKLPRSHARKTHWLRRTDLMSPLQKAHRKRRENSY
jgi:hypothetical protein